jgi:hypothetical protein
VIPDANTAYAGAPSILREMNNVLAMTGDLMKPGGRTPHAAREQKLRKAALLDRIALHEAAEYAPDAAAKAMTVAYDAARELVRFDTDHHTAAGPVGPAAPDWARDPRGYVRQEYAARHASTT